MMRRCAPLKAHTSCSYQGQEIISELRCANILRLKSSTREPHLRSIRKNRFTPIPYAKKLNPPLFSMPHQNMPSCSLTSGSRKMIRSFRFCEELFRNMIFNCLYIDLNTARRRCKYSRRSEATTQELFSLVEFQARNVKSNLSSTVASHIRWLLLPIHRGGIEDFFFHEPISTKK